jgi:hypothetical protein
MVRTVCSTLDELLAGATGRELLLAHEGKSSASLERVVIDGERYVVKHLHPKDDWLMRASGDLGCRPVLVWRSGLLDSLPPCIDHTVVAVADGLGPDGRGAALLMRDVSRWLVPPGDSRLDPEQEQRFTDHMGALHATFWDRPGSIELTPLGNRYAMFTPLVAELESADGHGAEVPRALARGWSRFPARAPELADAIRALLAEPWPLIEALSGLPQTLVHGDWKFGNAGSHDDGRTILLDWAFPGQAPGVTELTWYLALNTARLPRGKEASIDAYRTALERRGIDTRAWWDRGIELALLGAFLQFGWEKALGDDEELAWWRERAAAGVARL